MILFFVGSIENNVTFTLSVAVSARSASLPVLVSVWLSVVLAISADCLLYYQYQLRSLIVLLLVSVLFFGVSDGVLV